MSSGRGAGAGTGGDDILKNGNQDINLLDPPKDLKANSILKKSELQPKQLKELADMLLEIFLAPGSGQPSDFDPLADKKDDLLTKFMSLLTLYFNSPNSKIQVVRVKHSTGHDSRPEGLFVAQDAGPPDLVQAPQFILTPGSVLDPASKTKEGAVRLMDDPRVQKLERKFIDQVQLGHVINGDILMTIAGGDYSINVPITFADKSIVGTFNRATFKPKGAAPHFFGGNPEKNEYILNHLQGKLNNKVNCQKYLLAKELGDTLQVVWILFLISVSYTINGTVVTSTNTVITTNDTVVWLRCILNMVQVIFTDSKGISNLWGVRSQTATDLAAQQAFFITKIRSEVITHNAEVIKVIRAVSDFPLYKIDQRNTEKKWVNGVTWTEAGHAVAKSYLLSLITSLENMNKDIDKHISLVATAEAAKEIASRSHFLCPFKQKPDGKYYTINTVTFLLPEKKFNFKASLFTNTSFTGTAGTNRIIFQLGGGTRSRLTDTAILAGINRKGYSSLLDDIISSSELPNPHAIPATSIRTRAATREAALTANDYGFLQSVWAANVSPHLNSTRFFLFSYIRDYHPQIFTFANLVKEVLPERLLASYARVHPGMDGDYPTDYEFNPTTDLFILNSWIGDPDRAYTTAIQALTLAKPLIQAYPQIATAELVYFMNMLNDYTSEIHRLLDPETHEEVELPRQFGGGDDGFTQEIVEKALDLYEIYYSYRIRAAYEDRDLTQEELLEIRATLPTLPSIPGAPSKPKIRRSEFLPYEFESLPQAALAFGGNRYRKTKKRKASKNKKRKTRRSSRKRI